MKLRLALPLAALAGLALPASALAGGHAGAVYTLSNAPGGNRVVVLSRAGNGRLSWRHSVATGGRGTGANLGSQGALTLAGSRLFAVNAASNTLTLLGARGTHVWRHQVVASGGTLPTSVSAGRGLVYVLNAGGTPNVTGFRITRHGLVRIAGGRRRLAAGDEAPPQVSLNPRASALVVTNKSSNTIDTFTVARDGRLGRAVSHPSAGATPFGFAFTRRGTLVVSDAGTAPTSAASSYRVTRSGALQHLFGPAQTHQAAACWVAVTPDGRYAYTANAGSGTISGFRVRADGRLSLLDVSGESADTGAGSHPLDEAVTRSGRFFYVLADGDHAIAGFRVHADGSLSPAGVVGGLRAGDVGVAAR